MSLTISLALMTINTWEMMMMMNRDVLKPTNPSPTYLNNFSYEIKIFFPVFQKKISHHQHPTISIAYRVSF